MPEVSGRVGRLHYVVTGAGDPTTVFVPGLAQSIADTRPFGSAVVGTRVFVDLRGHGGSEPPTSETDWTYAGLASDVATVADATNGSRAVGVSLGAGSLVQLLLDEPGRFDRVVLALPSGLARTRAALHLEATDAFADAITSQPGGDIAAIVSGLVELQPAAVRARSDLKMWARRHASEIGGRRSIADAVRFMPRQVLASLEGLSRVTADVLVLAQRGDEVHTVADAEELASALPRAKLVVSDTPWVWGARAELRDTVSAFLND